MSTKLFFTRFPMILVLFAAMTLLGGCVTGKQAALDSGLKPLTNAELKALFAEKRTAKWYNSQKMRTSDVEYTPEGGIMGVGGGNTYPGTYKIKNDEFCSYMEVRSGQERCTSWFLVKEKEYKLFGADGSLRGILTFTN